MPTKNPVHPGRIVRLDCLEALGLSVTAGAKVLGVTRKHSVTSSTARLASARRWRSGYPRAFGSTAETWLRMQLAYDLTAARKNESKIKVSRQHVPQELGA